MVVDFSLFFSRVRLMQLLLQLFDILSDIEEGAALYRAFHTPAPSLEITLPLSVERTEFRVSFSLLRAAIARGSTFNV